MKVFAITCVALVQGAELQFNNGGTHVCSLVLEGGALVSECPLGQKGHAGGTFQQQIDSLDSRLAAIEADVRILKQTPAPSPAPTPAPTPSCPAHDLGTQANPGDSCRAINTQRRADHAKLPSDCPLPQDGEYVTADGRVACDMTTDGGGWTLRWAAGVKDVLNTKERWWVAKADSPPTSFEDLSTRPYKQPLRQQGTEMLFKCRQISGQEHWMTTSYWAAMIGDESGCSATTLKKVDDSATIPSSDLSTGHVKLNKGYMYGSSAAAKGQIQTQVKIGNSCTTTYGDWAGPVKPHWIPPAAVCFGEMYSGTQYTTGGYGTSSNHGVKRFEDSQDVRFWLMER